MSSCELPLFKLPGELRNQIYIYRLSRDDQLCPAAVFATQHKSKAVYKWSGIGSVHQDGPWLNTATRRRAADSGSTMDSCF
jgi:hypothetical protein